jgi:hypothetical protein
MGVISLFTHKFFFFTFVVFYIFTLMTFFVFYIQRLRLKVNFLTFNLNHLKELHVLGIVWDLNPLLSTAFHFICKYHVIVIVGSKFSRVFRVFYPWF